MEVVIIYFKKGYEWKWNESICMGRSEVVVLQLGTKGKTADCNLTTTSSHLNSHFTYYCHTFISLPMDFSSIQYSH